jgi:hypothetical protein
VNAPLTIVRALTDNGAHAAARDSAGMNSVDIVLAELERLSGIEVVNECQILLEVVKLVASLLGFSVRMVPME